jgi:hypothetical protein
MDVEQGLAAHDVERLGERRHEPGAVRDPSAVATRRPAVRRIVRGRRQVGEVVLTNGNSTPVRVQSGYIDRVARSTAPRFSYMHSNGVGSVAPPAFLLCAYASTIGAKSVPALTANV